MIHRVFLPVFIHGLLFSLLNSFNICSRLTFRSNSRSMKQSRLYANPSRSFIEPETESDWCPSWTIGLSFHTSGNPVYQQVVRFRDQEYIVELLSEKTLDEAVELIVDCHISNYFSPSTHTNSLLKPLQSTFQRYQERVLLEKVKSGILARCPSRIRYPTTSISDESVILTIKSINNCRLLALVELYPTDPIYLCNLSVCKGHRRQGLARILCALSEEFVATYWGAQEIVLHVEQSNIPAQRLYQNLDYMQEKFVRKQNIKLAETFISPLDSFLSMVGLGISATQTSLIQYSKVLYKHNMEIEGEDDALEASGLLGQYVRGSEFRNRTLASPLV